MSVLDRALSLGRILTIGLRRVVVGALNVESQCSWAAVPVFAMTLTMSSWSFIAAKMHVKVSTVSCATLWENTVTVGLRSRGDALYVESQCSSAVVQNCFSPWRFHRCSSWARLSSCPLRADSFGVQTCRKLWFFTVADSTRWLMSLLVQFIDGCGCPCVFAATVGLLLEVPQTQFIAGGGLSSFRDVGFYEGWWR